MAIRTRPCDDKDTSLFDGIHMYLGNNAIAIPGKNSRGTKKPPPFAFFIQFGPLPCFRVL